jgi:hypothetical protein
MSSTSSETGTKVPDKVEKLRDELVRMFPSRETDFNRIFSQVEDIMVLAPREYAVWFKDVYGLIDLADLFLYLYRIDPGARKIGIDLFKDNHVMIYMCRSAQ